MRHLELSGSPAFLREMSEILMIKEALECLVLDENRNFGETRARAE